MIYIFAINWQYLRLLNCKKGKFMLKKYVIILIFISFVLFSNGLMSQPGGGTLPPPPPPDETPIDGGIGFLLVLGLGYAVNKIRAKK